MKRNVIAVLLVVLTAVLCSACGGGSKFEEPGILLTIQRCTSSRTAW